MAVAQPARLTLDEFLAWEETQELRHEFVDGEPFAMVGATRRHNTIVFKLRLAFERQLHGRGCAVYHEGVKVLAGEHCFYPDLVITCARDDDDPRWVRQPVLLAEVLSPATEAYDRGKKWTELQRHLPGLQTYLLVAQDEARIDVYRRRADGWHYATHAGTDAAIDLSHPPCRLLLSEVYAGVLDRPADT